MQPSVDIEDHSGLVAYLRETGHIQPGELVRCTNLSGGISNRAVLVQRSSGETWVLKQALPKLRVTVDWFSDPARIEREALGLTWLGKLAPPGSIPHLVFEDRAHHLLAMQAVPQPHENWKTRLLAGRVEAAYVTQFAELLGAIHRRSYEQPEELASIFADRTFFETLRLEPYYRFTASWHPRAALFLNELIADTLATRLTIVHGDYSPKNVLIHEGRLILLDHEVVHFGDPAFDLGFSMTHFLSKAHHLKSHRITFIEATHQYWNSYRESAGRVARLPGLEARAVRHTLACLLARVDGRSPLEYLSESERQRQRTAVLALLPSRLLTVPTLIGAFAGLLGD